MVTGVLLMALPSVRSRRLRTPSEPGVPGPALPGNASTSLARPAATYRRPHDRPRRPASQVPRVPGVPACAPHPRPGRPPGVRRQQPAGQGPAPRGGRPARRRQHRLLRADGARQPRRRLRRRCSTASPAPSSSTRPSGPTCSTSPARPQPARTPAAAGQGHRPDRRRAADPRRHHRRAGVDPQRPARHARGQPARPRPVRAVLADPRRPANNARFVYLDPARRSSSSTGSAPPTTSPRCLRSEAGRNPHDKQLIELIGELSTRSDDFRTRWAAHNVRFHRTGLKFVHHPVVGRLDLNFEAMEFPAHPGLTLLVYIDRLEAAAGAAPGGPPCPATSPMASPPAAPATRRSSRAERRRTSASSPPTTTCCRRISRTSATRTLIREAARAAGAAAQVAGGVPAMCDGVTQGQPGMELSLFSRDVIAHGDRASRCSHDMFDAALLLGICDKIVPGLLIGALHFGHLPAVFVPAGPMPSRPVQQREVRKSASSTPRARSAARSCSRPRVAVLPRPRHLHLLRHRQHQPDADGGHGPAPAGRRLRQSEHAAARRAHPGRDAAGAARSRRSATTTRRSAQSSTSARSSTPSSACWRPAARPTTRIHRVAVARAAGIADRLGRLRRAVARSCRCWRASTRTATPT